MGRGRGSEEAEALAREQRAVSESVYPPIYRHEEELPVFTPQGDIDYPFEVNVLKFCNQKKV